MNKTPVIFLFWASFSFFLTAVASSSELHADKKETKETIELLNNPLTGKTAWNPAEGTVASILPGGSRHEFFKSWLDKIAVFMNGLKGNRGEFIPVIFRPYHELNGNWFWWGGKNCTADEFRKLWMF